MLFAAYKPASALSGLIENFWIYEGYASPHLKERIFPSGTFELVFNLRDDELRIYDDTYIARCTRFSGAIVSGPYSGFFVTDAAEEASVMGVHFKPGGAFPFLGLSADELANTHVDLSDVWGRYAGEVRERLSLAHSARSRFRLLESILLSRLPPVEHHPAVSLALHGLHFDRSRAVVRKLARQAGLSDRRFIDVFRFEVGVNPKLFNRILRFQHVLAEVHRIPEPHWGQLALEQGYFDQSHLIRDFIAFSGLSPADYLRSVKDLHSGGLHIKFNHLPVAR